MKLHSVRINGFAGIPHAADLCIKIEPFGRLTVLIGPNNAGKSSIIRFLMKVAEWMKQGEWAVPPNLSPEDHWKYDEEITISAELLIPIESIRLTSITATPDIVDSKGFFHITFVPDGESVSISPTRFASTGDEPYYHKSPKGHQFKHQDYKALAKELYVPFGNSFVFFDAIRALDRDIRPAQNRSFFGGTQPLDTKMEDGSSLLKELLDMQSKPERAREWIKFENDLKMNINQIFEPLGMPQVSQVEMKTGDIMQIHLNTMPQIPIPIKRLGTGISQLLIILSLLIRRRGEFLIVCIEEPESNLHPGLLRRFVDQLRTFDDVQFIFTTHSHVLLDCLTTEDRVFQLRQRADGSCMAELCDGIRNQHSLLDLLGIRASSLLQTNCVIWVEGPSDRLYIRQWIKEVASELAEGRDFTFNYYGGTLLAHLELNTQDTLANDFVSMLWISRFAIVFMDSDLGPDESKEKLAPRKKSIKEAAENDQVHRLAVVTNGRDIENDIPPELLLAASASILGCDLGKIKDAEIKGVKGFEHEIVSVLGETNLDLIKGKTRKLSDNKIAIAMKIVQMCDGTGPRMNPPEYINQMVDLIRRSERIEAAPRP